MLKKFYPSEYLNSTYEIDFKKLYQAGYRGVIFDIDNTLVEHGAPSDTKSKNLFTNLKSIGFKVCLLSNNKQKRVDDFNKEIKVNTIYKAQKPKIKNYLKAMKIMGTNNSNTIFVGDQIFTDIYGANRAGIKSYLVRPIDKKEEIQIVLKRYLEKIILFYYQKQLKITKDKK